MNSRTGFRLVQNLTSIDHV